MNLYLVTRTDGLAGWDEYDAFIVACESADAAKDWHPDGRKLADTDRVLLRGSWPVPPYEIHVKLLATNAFLPEGVILASFNAG